jgi:hypothetical protein
LLRRLFRRKRSDFVGQQRRSTSDPAPCVRDDLRDDVNRQYQLLNISSLMERDERWLGCFCNDSGDAIIPEILNRPTIDPVFIIHPTNELTRRPIVQQKISRHIPMKFSRVLYLRRNSTGTYISNLKHRQTTEQRDGKKSRIESNGRIEESCAGCCLCAWVRHHEYILCTLSVSCTSNVPKQ